MNTGGGFGTTTQFFGSDYKAIVPSALELGRQPIASNGLLSAKYVSIPDPLPGSVYYESKGYGEFVVEIQFRIAQGFKQVSGAFTVTDPTAAPGTSGAAMVYFTTSPWLSPSIPPNPPIPFVRSGDEPANYNWEQPPIGYNPPVEWSDYVFPCTYADPCVGQFGEYSVLQQNDPSGNWALPNSPNGIATEEEPWGIMGQIAQGATAVGDVGGATKGDAASTLTIQLAPGVNPEWIQFWKSQKPPSTLNTLVTPEPTDPSYMKIPGVDTPPDGISDDPNFNSQHRIYYINVASDAWDVTQPIPAPPTAGVKEGEAPNVYTNYDKMWPVSLANFDIQPAQKAIKTPFNYTTAPLSSTGVDAGSKARALWGGASPDGTPNAVPSTGGWMDKDWNTEYSQLACFPAYWNVAPQPHLLPMQPGGEKADAKIFSDAGGLIMGGGNVFIGNGIGAYTGRGAYFEPSSVEQPNADSTLPKEYNINTPPTLVTVDKTGTGANGTFFTYEESDDTSWSPNKPAAQDASAGAIGFPLDNLHQQYILLYRINQKIMEFNWKCAQQAADNHDYGIKKTWATPGNPLVIPYIGHVHHDKESYQVNKTPLYPVCDKTTGELSTAWLLGDDAGCANSDQAAIKNLIDEIRSYSPDAYFVWKQNRRLAGVSYEKYLYNRYMPAEYLPDWRVGGQGDGNPSHYLPLNSGCMIPCTGDRTPDGFSQTGGEILWDTTNKPWNINQQRNFGSEPSSYSKAEGTNVPTLIHGGRIDDADVVDVNDWTTDGGVGNYTNDLRSRMVNDSTVPAATQADGIQRYPMGWVNYKVECWAHTVPFGQSSGPLDASGASGASNSGAIFSTIETASSITNVAPGQLWVQNNTFASGTVLEGGSSPLKLCIKQGGLNDQEDIYIYTDPVAGTKITVNPKSNSLVSPAERYTSQGHNEAYQELYNIGEVKPPFADSYIYDPDPKVDPNSGKKPPPSPTITIKGTIDPKYNEGIVTYDDGDVHITGTISSIQDSTTLVFKEPVTYSNGESVLPKDNLGGKGTFPDGAKVTITTPESDSSMNAYISSSYWPTANSPFPAQFVMIQTPPVPGQTKQEYGMLYKISDNSGVLFQLPPKPTQEGQANYIPNKFGSACVPGETAPVCPTGKSVFCPKYPAAEDTPVGESWQPTKFISCDNETSDTSCYFNCTPDNCDTDISCCAVGPYYKLNAVTNTLISRVYNKYTCDVNGIPIGDNTSSKTWMDWRASFLGKNAVVTSGSSPALTDIWLRADTNTKGQAILPLDGRGTNALNEVVKVDTNFTYPPNANSEPVPANKKCDTDGVYASLQNPYIDLSNNQITLTGMYGDSWPGMPTDSADADSTTGVYYTIPPPASNGDFRPPQGPRQAIALFANEFIGGALTADPTIRPGNTKSGWSPSTYGVFKPDPSNNTKDIWPTTPGVGAPPYLRKGIYGMVPGPVESWSGSRCMETIVYGKLTEKYTDPQNKQHPTMNSKWISPSWTGTGDPNMNASPFTINNWKNDITGSEPEAGKEQGTLRESWNENGWSYDANSWGGEYNGLSSLQDKRDNASVTTSQAPTGYRLMKEFLAACASMQAGIRDASGSVNQESLHQARSGLYTIGFMPEPWFLNGIS